MVVDLKTYHLYMYFKALRTKKTPEDKKPAKTGWRYLLKSGSNDDTALPGDQASPNRTAADLAKITVSHKP